MTKVGGDGVSESDFAGFAIVELLGHRRLSGYVTEQEIAGAAFLRVEIPGFDVQGSRTIFAAPASIYALTPCTKEIALAVAEADRTRPVNVWDLRALLPERTSAAGDDDYPPAPAYHSIDAEDDEGDYDEAF